MSYLRVIPRDLFNEGNFLKCLGQLYINLDKMGMADSLIHEDDSNHFDVRQNDNDGSLYINNIVLCHNGIACYLYRPLNSRLSYPLWLQYEERDSFAVFNEDGTFTAEMVSFLKSE